MGILKKVGIFLPMCVFALMVGIAPVQAATGSLTCTAYATEPSTIDCAGSSWSVSTDVAIMANAADACGGTDQGDCTTDGSGVIDDCSALSTLAAGTHYLYGTEDACVTDTADTANPHVVTLAAGIWDLYTGLNSVFISFASVFGGIAILILGFALGLYGIKLGYSLLTNYVRVHRSKKD